MTAAESPDGVIDPGALWKDLQDLEAGTLPPDRIESLMALVGRSPAAQTAYLEYFEMTAMLEAEAGTHAEQGKLPVVSHSQVPVRLFRVVLLAAAAVIVLGAVVASLFIVQLPKPLTAEATRNAVWTVDGATSGDWTVSAGSTVRVQSGTLKLRFDSGAAMVIHSPASVYFPILEKPVLLSGWLWIDSENAEESFEIATPDLLVRDIGTRFAVRVPAEGPAEVHLIEGKAEVLSKAKGERLTLLEPGEQGFAIDSTGRMTGLTLARDPFPELAELLARPGNYATTVSGQNPAGYWRLDDLDKPKLANEIPGETAGGRHEEAVESGQGPAPADRFGGFGEDNRAARFLGNAIRAPVSVGATPFHDGLLFREKFEGDGPLDETAPDEASFGRKWIAAPGFGKDGTIRPGPGSATLAFSPVDGVVYTLDASVRGLTGAGSWVGLGFANGQSSAADVNSRFIGHAVVGRAWTFARGDHSVGPNLAYLGASGTNGGLADGAAWTGPLADLRGDVDLRVVLDTSAGPGGWKAAWYAKLPEDKTYTRTREARQLLNEDIRSVGLAITGLRTSGRIAAFTLRAKRSAPAGSEANLADAPAELSRKEGAVSFWMRRGPGARASEVLWTAGESPSDEALQARVGPDGRIGFFVENGRFDLLLTSEKSVADGQWHHIAATWSQFSVDLYIDGSMVARSAEFRGMQQGVLTEVRFGSGTTGSESTPFNGWIDEIALWNRPLTTVEVLHQFRSALGEPDAGKTSSRN